MRSEREAPPVGAVLCDGIPMTSPPCRRFAATSGSLVIVVVKEPAYPGDVLCDGMPVVPTRPISCGAAAPAAADDRIRAGDWLIDPVSGLKIRCVRGGPGWLTFDGRPLRPAKSDRPHAVSRSGACCLSDEPQRCRGPLHPDFDGRNW